MNSSLQRLRCPACGGAIQTVAARISRNAPRATTETAVECASCERSFARDGEILDMRLEPAIDSEPRPLARGDLERTFARSASGVPYRSMLEALLLELPDERAERLMLLVREARGAWYPLLRAQGGELLLLGNSLSGTVTPLTDAGFRVTLVDVSPDRARFARIRNEAHSPGRTEIVLAGDAPRLPFADGSFDVVVLENGLPGARRRSSRNEVASAPAFAHDLSECVRVSRGEVVLIADNRLGYKRSSGRRGELRVPGPLEYLAAAISPDREERTLLGYRHAFARAGCRRTRAFALYPHAQDFSHIVAIDERAPVLTIGPMERKNRWKLAARAIGLFPVLTPSFALVGERGRDDELAGEGTGAERKNGSLATAGGDRRPRAPSRSGAPTARFSLRIERILAELAEKIGEPVPRIEQLVSTRGNTAIVHTCAEGEPSSDARGRWTLHLPLAPKNIPQCERHHQMLELLRARFPEFPVPEPLFLGRAGGASVTCERRARGWTAPQRAGDLRRIERMLHDASAHFAKLVVRPPSPLTHEEFAAEVSSRFELVSRHAAVPATIANLARLHDELRERLIGKSIARVIYHADLRAKHVQIDADGRVTAYLDWGTAERSGLPYQDLLQLIVHERKQEAGLRAAEAWALVRERRGLRDHEREALASYARAVGLDDETCRASELMYPVLVAAMAEKNWEYSRPRWLHKQFDL
jgi:SAM-dependent methyltransferase/aminoglycoside phosphotransferase (APT) family kinase protein